MVGRSNSRIHDTICHGIRLRWLPWPRRAAQISATGALKRAQETFFGGHQENWLRKIQTRAPGPSSPPRESSKSVRSRRYQLGTSLASSQHLTQASGFLKGWMEGVDTPEHSGTYFLLFSWPTGRSASQAPSVVSAKFSCLPTP